MDVQFEIDLTEEEIDKLLEDIPISICVRTIANNDLRLTFLGSYAYKEERVQAIKQSLRNVGLVKGAACEGFFSRYKDLNPFEEAALLRGLNGRHFFYLIQLYRLQREGSAFTKVLRPAETPAEHVSQRRYTLFGVNMKLRTSLRVHNRVKETIAFYEKGEAGGLCCLGFGKLADHARYRIASILIDHGLLREFCLRQIGRKRKPSLELIQTEKKVKVYSEILKNAPSEETKEQVQSRPVQVVQSESEPEEKEPEETTVDIPTFTEETRERRRGAELDVDDGDAHFLGYARYGAYVKTWEEKAEERPFHKKTFAIVFLAAACLALLQVLAAPYLPQFLPIKKEVWSMASLHHLIAIVIVVVIAYKATFVRPTHRRDVSLFVATTALVFWVDTGSLVHFTLTPAVYCCVTAALALFYHRRPFMWVPFVVLVVYIVLTHTSVVNTCLAAVKLIVVGVSLTHEQRQGSNVGTILFAPYRDLLFVLEFPFIYICEFLEELDLI